MFEHYEPWAEDIPADLVPAMRHLREEFGDAHLKFGFTTRLLCHARLHKNEVDQYRDETESLAPLKDRIGLVASQRFDATLALGIPSAIFKSFWDFYLEGITVETLQIFKALVQIGRAYEGRLGASHLEWAKLHTSEIIRSHSRQIDHWVMNVCDSLPYDPTEESDERIHRRKWQAPRFLIMTPLRHETYDAARAWERTDSETSQHWRQIFCGHYTIRLERKLRKLAGDIAVEMAMQPRPESFAATTIAKSQSNIRVKSTSPAELLRRSVIFGALQADEIGSNYCKVLDARRLPIPRAWQDEGCPPSYLKAYRDDEKWRKRIQDEKWRYGKKYSLTPSSEQEKIIQQLH